MWWPFKRKKKELPATDGYPFLVNGLEGYSFEYWQPQGGGHSGPSNPMAPPMTGHGLSQPASHSVPHGFPLFHQSSGQPTSVIQPSASSSSLHRYSQNPPSRPSDSPVPSLLTQSNAHRQSISYPMSLSSNDSTSLTPFHTRGQSSHSSQSHLLPMPASRRARPRVLQKRDPAQRASFAGLPSGSTQRPLFSSNASAPLTHTQRASFIASSSASARPSNGASFSASSSSLTQGRPQRNSLISNLSAQPGPSHLAPPLPTITPSASNTTLNNIGTKRHAQETDIEFQSRYEAAIEAAHQAARIYNSRPQNQTPQEYKKVAMKYASASHLAQLHYRGRDETERQTQMGKPPDENHTWWREKAKSDWIYAYRLADAWGYKNPHNDPFNPLSLGQ